MYQIAYQILIILIPLITSPYIVRVLGAKGVGMYSYTYSVVSYFVLFAKLGIHVHGNRTIAMVRDDQEKLNQTFSDLLAVHLVASVIALFVYGGYIVMARPEYRNIAIIQALYIVAEMLEINWLYFGLEKFKITVIRNTIIKILTLAFIFIFVRSADDVWKYCAILAVGAVLSEIIVWAFLPKYVRMVKPDWKNVVRQIIPLISFFVPSVAVSLYKVMDKIMLGMMTDTVQVGYYENSEKIILIVLSIISAVGNVMMPRMSNLAVKGKEDQGRKLIADSIQIVMMATVAMVGGIVGVASVFAPVFWGDEFSVCDIYIKGLAFSMPFTAFANVIRTQFLIPKKKDKVFQGSVIVGACVNLIVNFVLIPRFQTLGAVIGTIMAECAVCLIQGIYVSKYLPIAVYLKRLVPYMLSAMCMYLVVYFIGNVMGKSIGTLVVQIFVGIVVYAGLAGIFLYVTKDKLWNDISKTICSILNIRRG